MTTEVDTICGMSVPTRKRILLTHAQNRNMAEGGKYVKFIDVLKCYFNSRRCFIYI